MGMTTLKGEGKSCVVTSYSLNHEDTSVVYIGLIARERSVVGALASDLMLGMNSIKLSKGSQSYTLKKGEVKYTCVYSKIEMGKDSYVHCIIYPRKDTASRIFAINTDNDEDMYEGIYSKLMELYDLPLLRRWSKAIADRLIDDYYIQIRPIINCVEEKKLPDQSFICISDSLTKDVFDELISSMIKDKTLLFNKALVGELELEGIDQFYIKYGQKIIEPVINNMNPLLPDPEASLKAIALKKTPFPQQAYIVNAITKLFSYRKNKVAFMIEEMGCGKSFQSIMAAEQTLLEKYMRQHPKISKEEAIKQLKYRVVIMSPGHILEKWQKEIISEIPNAKAIIINTRKQIIKLMEERGKKPDGKVFYILSKDFSKLSYAEGPAPVKESIRPHRVYECDMCGEVHSQNKYKKKCSKCNGTVVSRIEGYHKGAICPNCNNVIVDVVSGEPKLLTHFDKKRASNLKCNECDSNLWVPSVKNIGGEKEKVWRKVKVFTNKACKRTTSIWVHKDNIDNDKYTFAGYAKENGARKFAPSAFIKRKLGKNFFDVAMVDELHQYKGGATAQAQAMHSIISCSRKIIGMTGTLAGGYASDLFYMFWRLIPYKMVQHGFEYNSLLEFALSYGCVEERVVTESTDVYNSSSKGHGAARVKVKPGISALIYSDFMMGNTVYLSINDLSAFMPPYLEYIEPMDMDVDCYEAYKNLENDFMAIIKKRGPDSRRIVSTMLQTLLAYPDKPYGMEDIISPTFGSPLIRILDNSEFAETSCLLPKEERLIQIVNGELKENRNCFIYVEFTGDPQKYVVSKLVKILEENCNLEGQVAILKSSSPQSQKREAWIHQKAYEGKKVFITHPRCVETGLDFIFTYKDKEFNFPSLIFYQIGLNLFTMWQASRRAYRLIQKQECRTFYLAYEGTLQASILELMGEKKMATSVLQGKFSADALCSSSGDDVQYRLLKALQDNIDTSNLKTLENIYRDVNNQERSKTLTDDERKFIASLQHDNEDKTIIVETKVRTSNIVAFQDLFGSEDMVIISNKEITSTITTQKNSRIRQKPRVKNQMTLF